MRTICAYCKRVITRRNKEYDRQGKELISHGICPKCFKLQKEELDRLFKKAQSP